MVKGLYFVDEGYIVIALEFIYVSEIYILTVFSTAVFAC